MSSYKDETLKAEFFGCTRPHQSAAVNYQLATCLKLFDEEYQKSGRLGSLGHHFDRIEFARFVTQLILDDLENMGDVISKMETEVSFSCSHIPVMIDITSKTKFGDDVNNAPAFPNVCFN